MVSISNVSNYETTKSNISLAQEYEALDINNREIILKVRYTFYYSFSQ